MKNNELKMIDKYNNAISISYFGKPISSLSIGESGFLENYIHDLLNPEWKPVIINNIKTNFQDVKTKYEVSKTGQVRNSLTRRILQEQLDYHGYPKLVIKLSNGKYFNLLIHRAVANAFIPNPENKREVNHIDGIKTHYYYKNLEWATPSENIQHSYDTKLRPVGKKNSLSKYNEKDVRAICKLLETGMSAIDVSRTLNIDHHLVGNILNRACWKHISCHYDIPMPSKKNLLDEKVVHEICKKLSIGLSYAEVANSIDDERATRQTVRQIAIGSKWRSISDQYDIPGLEKSYNLEPRTLTEKVNRMYNSGLDVDTPTDKMLELCNLENIPKNKTMIAFIRRNYKKNMVNK